MAILEWLEETYPEPALLPGTARDRARVRAMAQILVADVQPLQNQSVTRYLQATVHLDEQGLKRWLHTWIARGLGAMEEMLRQDQRAGGFCLGERPTLADVCLVAQCASARRFGVEFTEYPAVAGVDQHCNALPAFQRAAPARQPDAPP
jgi:maleylacetoacetate isomerase